MTSPSAFSRRTFLAGLAGIGSVSLVGPGKANDEETKPYAGDRGLGGTGFIGTIQRFGSIIVNDSRIGFRPDVRVTLDGNPASVGDLRIGQVVQTVARTDGEGFTTTHIAVVSEVVGPIDRITQTGLTVLGQQVETAGLTRQNRWRAGQRVAVYGLRRIDETIFASRIEYRAPGRSARPDTVSGVVVNDGKALWIGNLPLKGVPPEAVGRRVTLTGSREKGWFVARSVRRDDFIHTPGLRRLSIETFARSVGDAIQTVAGLALDGHRLTRGADFDEARVVISASVDERGRTIADNVGPSSSRIGDRGPGAGRGPGPGQPTGRTPQPSPMAEPSFGRNRASPGVPGQGPMGPSPEDSRFGMDGMGPRNAGGGGFSGSGADGGRGGFGSPGDGGGRGRGSGPGDGPR
ncbi:hypothetical protein FHS82_002877 [Pseudochelatococcus lubricantis]|uniref:DUF5666 domain-containing protein n=1 Tax=Pseudochelatococcus lubricantis TaxID=1538102 RepID=A0ABX0V262_9HYPH|nr:DUF5666 domain-containing protein [Pseudochelatococcus lubricantis]NIJ59022.1 hypothetical protein [Pseudochelatococcus lubricantis]